MWRKTVVLAVSATVLVAGAVSAQTGTWNLPSATTLEDGSTEGYSDVRFFEDDNETWGVFLRGGFDDNGEASFGYFDWETTGEDPINGAVRQSNFDAVVADVKWQLKETSPRVAVRAGADLKVGSARGTNTATGASAYLNGAIPSASLPVEFGNPDGTLLILEPKIVWFDTQMVTDAGPPIEGFGTVVMIGGGVRYPFSGNLTFVADAAYPVDGSNSIDDATNAVTEELAWSAGVDAEFGRDWTAGVFASTAAGPTPATSAIATPDQAIGLGVRVGKAW